MKSDQYFFDKYLDRIGSLSFLALAIMAMLFYQERTLILDAAFQLYIILFRDELAIQFGRYVAAATQIFPYLAQKLGLPLNAILVIYSLSFVILQFLCFYLSKNIFQQKKTAWILVLFPILLCSHTFYWIQSELLQSSVLLIFTFGLTQYWRAFHWLKSLFIYALISLLLFSHPLIFIPFGFIWAFLFLSEKANRSYFFFSILGIGMLCIVIKYFILPQASYDQSHISLTANFWEKLKNYNSLQSTINFRNAWWTDYYLYPIILLVLIWNYLRTKEFWKLGLLLSFCAAYLLLVNTTYSWGIVAFHVESFYQVLSIFLLYPLVYDFFPKFATKKYLLILIPILMIIRLGNMAWRHEIYAERVAYLQELLDQTKQQTGTKFYSYEKEINRSKLFLSWSTPYESLMMSARLHPDSCRTLYISTQEKVDNYVQKAKPDQWLSPYGPIDQAALPQRYFRMKDTSGLQYLPVKPR